MTDIFNKVVAWFVALVSDVLQWLLDAWLWSFKKVFALIMEGAGDGFVAVADTVCVSQCIQAVTGISAHLSSLSPLTIYLFNTFQVGYGVSLVICAYIARFIIRRLPFIG